LACVAAFAVATGCSSSSPAEEGASAASDGLRQAAFVDAESILGGEDLSRWLLMKAALARTFERACPEGRCGGRLTRAVPVRLACSAARASGELAQCAWVFGEGAASVDGATGALRVKAKAQTCTIPMATTPGALAAALTAPGVVPAVARRIPGAARSFFDALAGCIDTGDAAPVAYAARDATHSDLAAALPDAARADWQRALASLDAGFDDVCGDTFCEGDYGDIASLGLACAADRSTGQVDGCTWTFVAATSQVAPRSGAVQAKTKVVRCPVAVHATARELVAALASPGATPAIRRALPGAAPALYDQLVGCL